MGEDMSDAEIVEPELAHEAEYRAFMTQQITCTCGWQGVGRDLQVGEVFESSGIGECHCPRCENYFGAVRFPQPKVDPNWRPHTMAENLANAFDPEASFYVLDGVPYVLYADWDYAERWDGPHIREVHPRNLAWNQRAKEISEKEFRAIIRRMHGLERPLWRRLLGALGHRLRT